MQPAEICVSFFILIWYKPNRQRARIARLRQMWVRATRDDTCASARFFRPQATGAGIMKRKFTGDSTVERV